MRALAYGSKSIEIVDPAKPRSGASQPTSTPAPPPQRPRTPAGTRASSNFFDAYPRFYETSGTSPYPDRLNLRYEAIFGENKDLFAGARVLDIASHDGRWSHAALACGAESVIGIEARAELAESSSENLAACGWPAERYSFLTGDVFEVMLKEQLDVDVVLCLGYLYHTLRFNELLHLIKKVNPAHLILDTESEMMQSGSRGVIVLRDEPISREGNAFRDAYSWGDTVLVGRPNLKAIEMMMKAYGFEVERLSDWAGLLRDNPGATHVSDYQRFTRVTIRARSTSRAQAATAAPSGH